MKWIAAYLAVYGVALALLAVFEKFDIVEPLFILIVAGGGLTLVAWLLVRRAPPVEGVRVEAPWWGIGAWLLLLAIVLGIGFPAQPLLKVAVKLLVFVVVPFVAFRPRFPLRLNRREQLVAVLLFIVMTFFQGAFGNGFRKIADAGLTGAPLALATLASFVWMSIEAGLVEEFSFRGIVQTRLEQLTRSAAGGIVITSIVFALIHVPGLYLRTGQTNESFTKPSLLFAICYAITILSPIALFLGYLWSRTRNLLLVVLVHGAIDMVPNVVEVAKTLRIQ